MIEKPFKPGENFVYLGRLMKVSRYLGESDTLPAFLVATYFDNNGVLRERAFVPIEWDNLKDDRAPF